jgi:exopolyphosphatase/pppGpp-phosphohydrolase
MARQRVGAAIDVGSNSVHLLVATVGPDGLRPVHDESELLGLGDVVDREGELPDEPAAQLHAALQRYVTLAHEMGARDVVIVATEPFRRARNASEVAAAIADAAGVPVHVLTETLEGELTYLGVSGGAPAAQTSLVVDIGGGSSEVIVAEPGRELRVTSLPTGSSRLSMPGMPDPPTPAVIEALRGSARGAVASLDPANPGEAVFVGGTATNLAKLAPLSMIGLDEARELLSRMTAEQISEAYGVNLRRARQLPAGAALVEALLRHYGLEQGAASDASLRDGAILAFDALGHGWPARLSDYVRAR